MSEPRATGTGGAFGLLIGLFLAVVLVAFAVWAFAVVMALVAILPWAWATWNERDPGQLGGHLRAWLAPRYHYPFVGPGSIVASVAGAGAILDFHLAPALSMLILVAIFARSISMAWFPWPRSAPAGLSVYPLVAVTGPVSSGLGILAVLVLIWGGYHLDAGSARQWVALDSVPIAVALVLLATLVGRIGRTVTCGISQNRLASHQLLSLPGVERAKAQAMRESPLVKPAPSGPDVRFALSSAGDAARQ